jgi:hypothetical protein
LGNQKFSEESKLEGIEGDFPKFGSAFSDFNNDGFVDMVSVPAPVEDIPIRFYENKTNDNNWISIKLKGTKSNRDSIGARITITTGNKKQIREVQAGSSYLSQNSLWQTFGIGQIPIIEKIEVRWPSGITKTLENINSGQRIVIEEPR